MWDTVQRKSDFVGLPHVPMLKGNFLKRSPISLGEALKNPRKTEIDRM